MTDLDLDEQRLRRTLRKVAEGTPVPPVDETLLIRVPPRSPHGHRRLLISVLATVVVVAGFAIAIAYGPRSSDVGGPTTGNTNVTSYPKVSETWAVPTPAGYVALKNRNRNDHLLGVQTLKSASYQRPGLRQAGWRSSIAEDWAPKALFRSDHPYSIDQTIFLTIDQFGSSTEAASYQTKLAALFLQQVPGEGPRVRLTVQGVPGAVAVQQEPGSMPPTGLKITYVVVEFHRGPYLVTLGGGETHFSVQLERLLEHTAKAQYGRLRIVARQ